MQEMMLIFLLALLLFGPKKLPELGKLLGKGLTEFRRAKNELKSTFESHLHELERETQLESPSKTPAPDYSSPQYPYSYDEYGEHGSSYGSSSESHDAAVSNETSASESSTASATATQDAEANREHASPTSSPVTGTVPRSNGSQSVEPLSAAVKEEHPA
jgi:sec-independent protein translocase protein TatA